MSSVCSGRTMRSVSRLPSLSNKHNSTFVAFAEKSAKFVPRPSQVAPSGCGEPLDSARLDLRNEIDGGKRWEDKVELRSSWRHNGASLSLVPHVTAPIVGGVGIENLAPRTG